MLIGSVKYCRLANLSIDEPNFNICSAFHSRAYSFTNYVDIQKVAKCDEKQWTFITSQYHTTRMAGRRDWACKHGQRAPIFDLDWPGKDDSLAIWEYCGNIDESNHRLMGRRLLRNFRIIIIMQYWYYIGSILPTKPTKNISARIINLWSGFECSNFCTWVKHAVSLVVRTSKQVDG
jgi:hypothetical protein